jgi:autophagy-related protein 9
MSIHPTYTFPVHVDDQLDELLTNIYTLWREKGLIPLLVKWVMDLSQVMLVGVIVWFVITMEFSITDTSTDALVPLQRSSPSYSIWIVILIWGGIWTVLLLQYCYRLVKILQARHFLITRVGIDSISACTWSDVVMAISRTPGLVREKRFLNPLDITMRLCRRDNYFTALIMKMVIEKSPLLSMSKILEWGLYVTLFHHVVDNELAFYYHQSVRKTINDQKKIDLQSSAGNQSIKTLVANLSFRFTCLAALLLICIPFVCLYLVAHLILNYGSRVKIHPGKILSRRVWSRTAYWVLREWNELPHQIEERLRLAHPHAVQYITDNSPQSPYLVLLSRMGVSVCASLLTVVIGLGIIHGDVVITKVDWAAGRNGTFWIAILSIGLMMFESLVTENAPSETDSLEKIMTFLHVRPPSWINRACRFEIRNQVASQCELGIIILARELMSVLLAPFLFWYRLPQLAPDIVDVIISHTIKDVPGVGDVCQWSHFDFIDQFGEQDYGAATSTTVRYTDQCPDGKMVKSLVSFAQQFPSWKGTEAVQRTLYVNLFNKTPDEYYYSQRHEHVDSIVDSFSHSSWWHTMGT